MIPQHAPGVILGQSLLAKTQTRTRKEGHRIPNHGYSRHDNVAPDLMEGSGIMKSFGEIIQNQLLFEGFGIMKSSGDRNNKIADSEF